MPESSQNYREVLVFPWFTVSRCQHPLVSLTFSLLLFISVDHFAAVSHSGAGGFPQVPFQSNIFFSSLLQLWQMLGFLFPFSSVLFVPLQEKEVGGKVLGFL